LSAAVSAEVNDTVSRAVKAAVSRAGFRRLCL
jgi:hypothetical protein